MTSGTIDSGIPIPASQRMEMESLLSTLVALKGGRGRIIEIAGAPGTGKSRILAAISARAQRMGFAVLNAHYAESVGPENIPVHGGSPFSGAPVPTNGRLLHEALGALPPRPATAVRWSCSTTSTGRAEAAPTCSSS